jgi:signal transduction histidine kinase
MYGDRRGRNDHIAEALSLWLASFVPGARVLILRVAADRRTVTAIAGDAEPRRLRTVPPALTQTLARASRTARPPLVPAWRGEFRTVPPYRHAVRMAVLPLRLTWAPGTAAAVLLPRGRFGARHGERLLSKALHRLNARLAPPTGTSVRAQALIMRAKQEWESTVDALPELICLVDRDRSVLRANRAFERWGLGTIRSVLGRPLHEVFHPGCDAADCGFERALDTLWAAHPTNGHSALDIEDRVLGKTLALGIRAMPAPAPFDPPSPTHAVFVAADVTALRNAERELHALNRDLERRVDERTRELLGANAELREQIQRREEAERALMNSRNELRLLSVQLMTAQESERKRIAQELHDAVGQSLSAIKYAVERAAELARHPRLGDPAAVLRLAVAQVQNTMDEVRSISANLHPPVLDDMGAMSAVRWLCREWGRVYYDIKMALRVEVGDAEIPEGLATAVFRTVQEALNNVAKHAAARAVSVNLRRDGAALIVEVTDDGVGLPAPDGQLPKRGYGLRGMRERAEHTGGELSIAAQPGTGTVLRVRWPLALAGSRGEKTA